MRDPHAGVSGEVGERERRRKRGRQVPSDEDRKAPMIDGRVRRKAVGHECGDTHPGAIAEPGIRLKKSLTSQEPPRLGGERPDDELGKGQVA